MTVFRLILYSGFRTALDDWVSRRPTTNRSVSLAWQKYGWVAHHAGARCDIYVDGDLLCFFIGDDLVKTATRTGRAEIRNNGAFVPPNGLTTNQRGRRGWMRLTKWQIEDKARPRVLGSRLVSDPVSTARSSTRDVVRDASNAATDTAVVSYTVRYVRLPDVARSRHACSQRRQTSAQMRQ